MIYDQNTVVQALGTLPVEASDDGLAVAFEASSEDIRLRLTFQPYDDEALVEGFMPSGRCGLRLRLPTLLSLRRVDDPTSHFLELQAPAMTVGIWFQPAPRVDILAGE